MSSTLEQNMRATTESFLYSFNGQWKPNITLELRTPECIFKTLPSTLGHPPRNNEEWAVAFGKVAHIVTHGNMTIRDYLAVPKERRAVCYSTMDAESIVGPFKAEYVWFLRFDESGEKFTEIVEFMDTKATADILSKVQEAQGGEQH